MAQTLRLKRSSVAGRVPTTASLQTGELAINTADGLVYIRKDDDSIIPLIGVNTAAVTGSVVLLGSITATSFTGSFAGDFSGSVNATLAHSASSGAGIVTFTFDGSDNVTVSLDTGSAHFVDGVNKLIAVGTALSASYAITASYAQNAAIAQTAVTASYTLVAQEVLGLDTGSFVITGSISNATITLNQADGTSFNLVVDNVANAISASYAATASIATSSSFAESANTAISSSHAIIADNATSASFATTASYAVEASIAVTSSYSVIATSAISSSYATSASYAVTSDTATSASYVLSASYSTFSTFASNAAEVLITGDTLAPDKYYLTFTTGSGYNFLQIDSEVLSYFPATNILDHKGLLIVSGNILLTGVVVGDDILINDWGSVSASLASIEVGANSLTLQQVTDNGSSTTNSITAPSFTGSLLGTASYAEGYVRDGGGAANQITVWTNGDTVTGYSTFVRDSNGNLGIGTSSPVRSIDVVSSTGTSVGLKLNSTATGGRSYSFFSTNNASGLGGGKFGIYDDTAQAGRIVLDGNGNVGIGSTAPTYKLDVIGDTRVTGDLVVTGKVTAEEFHTEFVSSSIIYSSGSTKFGDTIDDVHQFTGSVFISGSTVITGSLAAPDITINDWGSVSASLAAISGSAANAYGLTLQEVTDNGNQTTNHVSISSSLNVQDSIYSKGEEVLDFAVAMAIALG